jgi:hypothetical protein
MFSQIKIRDVRVDATPESLEKSIREAVLLAVQEDRTVRLRW